MKAISQSNSKEIKHENDLDFSVYAVIRLFSIIDNTVQIRCGLVSQLTKRLNILVLSFRKKALLSFTMVQFKLE